MERGRSREDFWRGHIEAWRASALSQKTYCAEHGLGRSTLGYWIRRLKRAQAPSVDDRLTLVPARVTGTPGAPGALSMVSAGGWTLEFATLPPAPWLVALLEHSA